MQIERKLVDLTPGLAVTMEIKTGRRRIIEYLLPPLLRSVTGKHEGEVRVVEYAQ